MSNVRGPCRDRDGSALGQSRRGSRRKVRGRGRKDSLAAERPAPSVTVMNAADDGSWPFVCVPRTRASRTGGALRWHARYCREVPGVSLNEAAAVLALLSALVGRSGATVAVSAE